MKPKERELRVADAEAGAVVDDLIRTIREQRDYLSEIDGAIGDGDHGVNMHKGFSLTAESLKARTSYPLSEGLIVLGETLLTKIGGSLGPLYGTFFIEMGKAAGAAGEIDRAAFGVMLNAASAALQSLSAAKPGDKTMLDTLVPAVEAYAKSLQADKSFAQCLDDMQAAAHAGWQSTQDMAAKIGRASRLGERSRGALDAGATSCYFILASIAAGMRRYDER